MTFAKHPYQITFLYPHTATTTAEAMYAVTLKAPERGNRRQRTRNQSFQRLKNGAVVVYDNGNNMSDLLSLSFELVPQAQYAALLLFLETVVWGANKIRYIDWAGAQRIVRVYKATIDSTDKGSAIRDDTKIATVQYDFSLDILDVTDNIADTGQTAVPTQLALHIADTDHPHNPKLSTYVDSTLSTVEEVSVDAVAHVTWLVTIATPTYNSTRLVHATHDGTVSTDATAVAVAQEALVSLGTDPTDITLSVDLTGAATAQVMRLRGVKTSGTAAIAVRRIKI